MQGDAFPYCKLTSPHQDLASPHQDLECWMIRQKRPNSSPNFGEKRTSISVEDLFFFGLHLISDFGKKNTSISGEDLFIGGYSISTTELHNLH